MGQGPHRNGSVVGGHAAKFTARYQHSACAQVRSTEGSEHTRGSSANNDEVDHLRLFPRPQLSSEHRRKVTVATLGKFVRGSPEAVDGGHPIEHGLAGGWPEAWILL